MCSSKLCLKLWFEMIALFVLYEQKHFETEKKKLTKQCISTKSDWQSLLERSNQIWRKTASLIIRISWIFIYVLGFAKVDPLNLTGLIAIIGKGSLARVDDIPWVGYLVPLQGARGTIWSRRAQGWGAGGITSMERVPSPFHHLALPLQKETHWLFPLVRICEPIF